MSHRIDVIIGPLGPDPTEPNRFSGWNDVVLPPGADPANVWCQINGANPTATGRFPHFDAPTPEDIGNGRVRIQVTADDLPNGKVLVRTFVGIVSSKSVSLGDNPFEGMHEALISGAEGHPDAITEGLEGPAQTLPFHQSENTTSGDEELTHG